MSAAPSSVDCLVVGNAVKSLLQIVVWQDCFIVGLRGFAADAGIQWAGNGGGEKKKNEAEVEQAVHDVGRHDLLENVC